MGLSRALSLLGLGLTVLAPCLLGGCGDSTEVETVEDVRTRDEPRRHVPKGLTSAERYGYRSRGRGGDSHGGAQAARAFGWKTPAGWEEQARRDGSIRKGSWAVAGEPRTDCSLVMLGGSGGGLALNVNRWRKEMGLAEVGDDVVAAMPRRTLLKTEATYVDLTGAFSGGRSGSGALDGARMLGLILSLPRTTLFLKFTGPAAVVKAQRGAFEALGDSITFGPVGPRAGAGNPPKALTKAAFAWDVPEGWGQQPPRMMRVVTFIPADAPTSWCYAARLGGGAGGLLNNVNRWRREMGHAQELDEAAVGALPTLDVLGTKAVFLDLEGDFSGTGGNPLKAARMFGVVCPRGSDVIFIKMVGPAATLATQREAFTAFCTSLREAK